MQCESSGNGGDYERWEGAAKQTQITRRQLPVDLEFQNFICFLAMSLAFAAERQLAVAAVQRACILTSSVFNKLIKNETLTKDDKTPVTGMVLGGVIFVKF